MFQTHHSFLYIDIMNLNFCCLVIHKFCRRLIWYFTGLVKVAWRNGKFNSRIYSLLRKSSCFRAHLSAVIIALCLQFQWTHSKWLLHDMQMCCGHSIVLDTHKSSLHILGGHISICTIHGSCHVCPFYLLTNVHQQPIV